MTLPKVLFLSYKCECCFQPILSDRARMTHKYPYIITNRFIVTRNQISSNRKSSKLTSITTIKSRHKTTSKSRHKTMSKSRHKTTSKPRCKITSKTIYKATHKTRRKTRLKTRRKTRCKTRRKTRCKTRRKTRYRMMSRIRIPSTVLMISKLNAGYK